MVAHRQNWPVGSTSPRGDLQAGAFGGRPGLGLTAVDDFNRLFLDIFYMSSGNMLKAGNVLTWNVWFNHPELVDQKEWREHAEKWRKSIDVDHTSPDRRRTPARFHDGAPFQAADELVDEEVSKIYDFIRK